MITPLFFPPTKPTSCRSPNMQLVQDGWSLHIETIATFLVNFGAHVFVRFITKVKILHGEVTPLSSWKPRANKKKSTFSKLHHQNGSNVYQVFFMSRYTWSLLHSRKWWSFLMIFNQIWWSFFLENKPFLTRMTQNWTKKITRKNKDN